MIEFALVLPLLLLLLLGIVDFGTAFNYQNDEANLANQAIRYADVNACAACAANSRKYRAVRREHRRQLRAEAQRAGRLLHNQTGSTPTSNLAPL